MRKLKLFLLLFVAAGSIYSLTACKDKDDDKNDSSSIVGTWEDRYEDGYDRITFNADGSYTWTLVDDKGTDTEYGTYTYDGRNLTLKNSDGDSDTFDVTISGNEMIWNVEGERYVYIRQ